MAWVLEANVSSGQEASSYTFLLGPDPLWFVVWDLKYSMDLCSCNHQFSSGFLAWGSTTFALWTIQSSTLRDQYPGMSQHPGCWDWWSGDDFIDRCLGWQFNPSWPCEKCLKNYSTLGWYQEAACVVPTQKLHGLGGRGSLLPSHGELEGTPCSLSILTGHGSVSNCP